MHFLSRLRRPSFFAAARAVAFLIAPIPAMRWWHGEAHYSIVEWYFVREVATPLSHKISSIPYSHRLGNLFIEHGLERDVQLYNVHLWIHQNRPWTLRTSCFIAQTLGVVGAAGALLQSRRRRHGHCPHCDYSLQGLTSDALGQLKCPECGAAGIRVRVVVVAGTPKSPEPSQEVR